MNDDTKKMIFEELRKGTVPEEGHSAFAVGIDGEIPYAQRSHVVEKMGSVRRVHRKTLVVCLNYYL